MKLSTLIFTGTKTGNATTNLSRLLPVATMTEDNYAKLHDEQPRMLFFCPVNETLTTFFTAIVLTALTYFGIDADKQGLSCVMY